MTEEVNVGMGSPAPKKGMSKGCLIALIVGGVLLLLIGGLIFYTVYYKGEDVVKFSVATVLSSSKQMLVESKLEGVDTVKFNAVVDNFNKELYADSSFNMEEIANLLQKFQTMINDKSLDASEVDELLKTLTEKYPNISPGEDFKEVIDSTQTESM